NRDDPGRPLHCRGNLQSCNKRNISREYRLRCELPGKPCSGEPEKKLERRIGARESKRDQTRRVEAIRQRAFYDSTHGLGCLQTCFSIRGPGGCHVHSDSEARMGCRGGGRSGGKRRRIRAYIGELFVTVQQQITSYFRSSCMRTQPGKRTACASRRPLAGRRTPIIAPARAELWRILCPGAFPLEAGCLYASWEVRVLVPLLCMTC